MEWEECKNLPYLQGRTSIYRGLEEQFPLPSEERLFQFFQQQLQTHQVDQAQYQVWKQLYNFDSGHSLSDEEFYYSDENRLRFVPGGEDGTAWFHVMPEEEKVEHALETIKKPLFSFFEQPSVESFEILYMTFVEELGEEYKLSEDEEETVFMFYPPISYALPFVQFFYEWAISQDEKTLELAYNLSLFLTFESVDRLPVKVGLLMLGALPIPRNEVGIKKTMLLGYHEEFSWYVCRFLYQILPDPLCELWEVACATKGWGRIFALHLLFDYFENIPPEPFVSWLLEEGYQNDVMPHYTAADILIKIQPHHMFDEKEPTEAALRGVQTILHALVEGGPFQFELEQWDDFQDCSCWLKQQVKRQKLSIDLSFLP